MKCKKMQSEANTQLKWKEKKKKQERKWHSNARTHSVQWAHVAVCWSRMNKNTKKIGTRQFYRRTILRWTWTMRVLSLLNFQRHSSCDIRDQGPTLGFRYWNISTFNIPSIFSVYFFLLLSNPQLLLVCCQVKITRVGDKPRSRFPNVIQPKTQRPFIIT